MKTSNIGLIGLAVMGENLALNMESKGFTVSVYNRTAPGEEGVVDRFMSGRGKGKNFIASTFYIKNNGELIGMLCLNTDTTIITNFMKATHQFVGCLPVGVSMTMGETITEPTTMVEENLDVPIVSFAESIISKTIADSNIAPERMTRQEKMEIVWELTNQGIPRMKGAISEIAKQLELSESTVYRYISLKED